LQLSPDGKLLAYIKPDAASGTANIFVRKLPPQGARPSRSEGFESEISIFARDGTDSDVQITFDSDQGVSSYSWTEDGGSVVFIQDKDGDENFHLYLSSVNNPAAAIDLTPFPGVKAEGIVSSERFPDRMFIVSLMLGLTVRQYCKPVMLLLVERVVGLHIGCLLLHTAGAAAAAYFSAAPAATASLHFAIWVAHMAQQQPLNSSRSVLPCLSDLC
jgi:hypothetical protein